MGNADKLLRFKLLPCPICRGMVTVDAIRQTRESTWTLTHTCPAGPLTPGGPPQYGKITYINGENLRMTVHRWNKYAKEWKP